mmetsp:Transcript_98697/g.170020  ORF Transcript_98697/g.170020 Transcript_98697/m.170020 type:complete len:152 (-) Transcript_98697:340-795(-)
MWSSDYHFDDSLLLVSISQNPMTPYQLFVIPSPEPSHAMPIPLPLPYMMIPRPSPIRSLICVHPTCLALPQIHTLVPVHSLPLQSLPGSEGAPSAMRGPASALTAATAALSCRCHSRELFLCSIGSGSEPIPAPLNLHPFTFSPVSPASET